jgi:hypothetical protein
VVLDLVVAKGDIELSKERKRTYELNRHFQDTWALKLPWSKWVLRVGGKVVLVQCKICTQIEGRKKLLVLKSILYGNMLDVAKPW